MVALADLWLPIVVSGIVLFFASAIAWMALPHHKPDWKKLADEDGFRSAIKTLGIGHGRYTFPHHASGEEMKSEEFQARWKEGPIGTLSIWPNPNMGANMLRTVVFFLGASFTIAYLCTIVLSADADFMRVFRFVGTAGMLTYCAAGIPNAIWFHRPIATDLIDGVAYALLTGVIFGLLWP